MVLFLACINQLIIQAYSKVCTCSRLIFFPFFPNFLLGVYFIYISNAIPKVPYTLPCPVPLPTHSHFLALVFPHTEACRDCKTKGLPFPMMAD